jgi:hypothetical protein
MASTADLATLGISDFELHGPRIGVMGNLRMHNYFA